MHRTIRKISSWSLATILLVVCGCTPPEREARAPDAVPEETRVELKAEPARPPAEAATQSPAADVAPQIESPMDEPASQSQELIAQPDDAESQGRTAFYRPDSVPAEIPRVELSMGHEALCRVKVGDTMPSIELPRIGERGNAIELAELSGEKATVVVFWTADRRMAREQLADLRYDVIDQFSNQGVAIVGIAVRESEQRAAAVLRQSGANFPNLLDQDGEAFAKVGTDRLPRTYLLDSEGKILWFDIEYSLATRRELHQALRALVGEPASAGR